MARLPGNAQSAMDRETGSAFRSIVSSPALGGWDGGSSSTAEHRDGPSESVETGIGFRGFRDRRHGG